MDVSSVYCQWTGSLDQPWLPRSARASPKLNSQEAPPGQRKIQKGLGDGNFVQVLDLPMPKSARLRKALDVFAATSHAKLGNGILWKWRVMTAWCTWESKHIGTSRFFIARPAEPTGLAQAGHQQPHGENGVTLQLHFGCLVFIIPWCLGGHTWHPWACQMVCCSCNWKAAHGGTLTDTSWHTIHDY